MYLAHVTNRDLSTNNTVAPLRDSKTNKNSLRYDTRMFSRHTNTQKYTNTYTYMHKNTGTIQLINTHSG